MEGFPVEIHLEIVRNLCLRDFKAFRRICKSFSKIATREYQRYRWNCDTYDDVEQTLMCMSGWIWWELQWRKTVREFMDYLDECEEPRDYLEKCKDLHSKVIRACVKYKLWNVRCKLDVWNKTTLWIDGKMLVFDHEGRAATIDGAHVFYCNGASMAEVVVREVLNN